MRLPAICTTTKSAALAELPLKSGRENIADNLRSCYKKLIDMSLIGAEELTLLDAWLADVRQLRRHQPQ